MKLEQILGGAFKMKEAKAAVSSETKEEFNEQQAIQKWKAEYGKIYKSIIDEEIYIWRKLKRKEYVQIMSNKSVEGQEDEAIYGRQDTIAETVVLFPSSIKELLENNAGLGTTIADEVLLKSGFELSGTVEL
jgi:hypothetical protein